MKVLISAGHSDKDPGAVYKGITEASIVTEFRDLLVARLKKETKHTIVSDGLPGKNLPLDHAITLAKVCDIAIEFHCNAGKGTGIEVLSKRSGVLLSQKIAKCISDATGLKLRGDKGWKAPDSGQHKKLGFCEAGGAIVELFFIDNEKDMKQYNDNKTKIIDNLVNLFKGM